MLAAAALTAAFFLAIRQGDSNAVSSMLEKDQALVNAQNPDGATPPLWAVYSRHNELLPIFTRYRPLDFFEACAAGDRERAFNLLGEQPHLYESYSSDGFTPLGLAIFFGHREIAERLLEAGADVNTPSKNSIRVAPLHSAVASGNISLLKLLLAKGAFVDPVEFLGATPLMAAAAEGKGDMVELLLSAGADPAKKTKDGKTAAELARASGHPALADHLTRALEARSPSH